MSADPALLMYALAVEIPSTNRLRRLSGVYPYFLLHLFLAVPNSGSIQRRSFGRFTIPHMPIWRNKLLHISVLSIIIRLQVSPSRGGPRLAISCTCKPSWPTLKLNSPNVFYVYGDWPFDDEQILLYSCGHLTCSSWNLTIECGEFSRRYVLQWAWLSCSDDSYNWYACVGFNGRWYWLSSP